VKNLSNDTILRSIEPYGITASARLCDQVRTYIELLLRWNLKTSLTTITDIEEILRFHFGESMLAVTAVPIRHGRLADVGPGAGFPAVPIRMVSEDLNVILIESNQKKAAFLSEIVRELHLTNVEVRRARMEDIDLSSDVVDFVAARALGIDGRFLNWSRHALNPAGSVVLWLGDQDARRVSQDASFKWADPIRIPHSDRRVIVHGSII
jgi:16S rRNA (guanine(527)-N(7))-methyltransferase RsmG